MFQYVEHQDKRKTVTELKPGIESSDVNARAMWTVRTDQGFCRLDSSYLSKLQKLIEEQSITAADVQNSLPP